MAFLEVIFYAKIEGNRSTIGAKFSPSFYYFFHFIDSSLKEEEENSSWSLLSVAIITTLYMLNYQEQGRSSKT